MKRVSTESIKEDLAGKKVGSIENVGEHLSILEEKSKDLSETLKNMKGLFESRKSDDKEGLAPVSTGMRIAETELKEITRRLKTVKGNIKAVK